MALDLTAIKNKLNQLNNTDDRKNAATNSSVRSPQRKPIPRNVFPLRDFKKKYAFTSNIWKCRSNCRIC
jgi:hypothetical protein